MGCNFFATLRMQAHPPSLLFTLCHSDARAKRGRRNLLFRLPHSVSPTRHKSGWHSLPNRCKKDPDYEGVMAMRSHGPFLFRGFACQSNTTLTI